MPSNVHIECRSNRRILQTIQGCRCGPWVVGLPAIARQIKCFLLRYGLNIAVTHVHNPSIANQNQQQQHFIAFLRASTSSLGWLRLDEVGDVTFRTHITCESHLSDSLCAQVHQLQHTATKPRAVRTSSKARLLQLMVVKLNVDDPFISKLIQQLLQAGYLCILCWLPSLRQKEGKQSPTPTSSQQLPTAILKFRHQQQLRQSTANTASKVTWNRLNFQDHSVSLSSPGTRSKPLQVPCVKTTLWTN